jgi:hypothetical protein
VLSPAAISSLEKSMELRGGGDSYDWIFLATAHFQRADTKQAHMYYDRAVAAIDKQTSVDEELIRFRAEAEVLLDIEPPQAKEQAP